MTGETLLLAEQFKLEFYSWKMEKVIIKYLKAEYDYE